MIEDKTQEDKILNILDSVICGYTNTTLKVSYAIDNEDYKYIHARFNNVKEEDIVYIKSYLNIALPNINKGWLN